MIAETLPTAVPEKWMADHAFRAMTHGTRRNHTPAEYRSAAIPCNQRNCTWELDIEWRDTADPMHWAALGTETTEALLRDHLERLHGIPVMPEGYGDEGR